MKKILVIDDSIFDSSLIATNLKQVRNDIEIIVINDSANGVAEYRKHKPDLTLLDISMPELNGFDVLEQLRDLPERSDHKVVMLSGSPSRHDRKRSAELGADGYRVKPANLSDYKELASELVSPGFISGLTGITLNSTTFQEQFHLVVKTLQSNLSAHHRGARTIAFPA